MSHVIGEHIEIVQGADGPKARVAGHRVRVLDIVVRHEKLGMSPDEIVHDYPSLTLAEIHADLAYYRDHREGIERTIDIEARLVDEFRVGPNSGRHGRTESLEDLTYK